MQSAPHVQSSTCNQSNIDICNSCHLRVLQIKSRKIHCDFFLVGGGGGLFDEPVMPDPEPEAEISNLQQPPLEPPGSHRSVPGSYRTAPPGSMRSPGGPMSDDGFGGGASPMGPPSPMASSPGNSRPPSPMATPYATPGPGHEPGTPAPATPAPATPAQAPPTPAHMMLPPAVQEQTTLLHNEEESFALVRFFCFPTKKFMLHWTESERFHKSN